MRSVAPRSLCCHDVTRPSYTHETPVNLDDTREEWSLCALIGKGYVWASSFAVNNFSGPKDIGSSCSRIMTVDLPSLSYINIGVFGYLTVSK